MKKYPSLTTGFTLIELLVTLAIVAVISMFAIPSFLQAIRNNQLTTYNNELLSALTLARSEAVKRGTSVTVRKVDNNSFTNLGAGAEWEDGWDVFVDVGNDGTFNNPQDTLIKTYPALKANYTLRGDIPFVSRVRFNSLGQTGASGRLVVCDDRDGNGLAEADTSRMITIISTGRARSMPDTDSPPNGLPDDAGGTDNTLCDP